MRNSFGYLWPPRRSLFSFTRPRCDELLLSAGLGARRILTHRASGNYFLVLRQYGLLDHPPCFGVGWKRTRSRRSLLTVTGDGLGFRRPGLWMHNRRSGSRALRDTCIVQAAGLLIGE